MIELKEFIMRDFNASKKLQHSKCYGCVYRRSVPGSAHSSCSKGNALTEFDAHGVANGWAMWPIDFDPAWLNSCDSYIPKEPKLPEDYESLVSMTYVWLKYIQAKAASLRSLDMFMQLKGIVDSFSNEGLFENDTEENKKEIKEIILKVRGI